MARWICLLFAASFSLSTALAPSCVAAQAYPVKTVRIIVPAQPGGGLDLIGRTIGRPARPLAEPVVRGRERVGGGGQIATVATARAAPDGYTLMVGYVGTHGTNPAVRKVPYDAVKDFTPIAMVGGTPNILVVHPSVPATDLKSLVAYAKANSGKMNYASGGIGTLNHLAMEQFRSRCGLRRGGGALPRHRPGDQRHRSPARSMMMMPGARRRAAAHPLAEDAADRDHRPEAPPAAARGADLRGIRLQGLRRRAVVRHRRPGETAGATSRGA